MKTLLLFITFSCASFLFGQKRIVSYTAAYYTNSSLTQKDSTVFNYNWWLGGRNEFKPTFGDEEGFYYFSFPFQMQLNLHTSSTFFSAQNGGTINQLQSRNRSFDVANRLIADTVYQNGITHNIGYYFYQYSGNNKVSDGYNSWNPTLNQYELNFQYNYYYNNQNQLTNKNYLGYGFIDSMALTYANNLPILYKNYVNNTLHRTRSLNYTNSKITSIIERTTTDSAVISYSYTNNLVSEITIHQLGSNETPTNLIQRVTVDYNTSNSISEIRSYDENNDLLAFTTYTYDSDGFLIEQREYNDLSVLTEAYSWTFESVADVTENNNVKMIIYPNPCIDVITIESNFKIRKVEIMDFMGRKLITTTNEEISIENLSAGEYFVAVTTEKGNTVQKIIKQ